MMPLLFSSLLPFNLMSSHRVSKEFPPPEKLPQDVDLDLLESSAHWLGNKWAKKATKVEASPMSPKWCLYFFRSLTNVDLNLVLFTEIRRHDYIALFYLKLMPYYQFIAHLFSKTDVVVKKKSKNRKKKGKLFC